MADTLSSLMQQSSLVEIKKKIFSVLQLLIFEALFFLALTIVAYVDVMGWFTVGFTCTAALGVILLLAVQWM
jgi:hypothetical protein